MKKQLMAVLLILCIGTAELVAQETDTLTTLPTILISKGTVVNKAVDKAFKKAFPLAKNLKWYSIDKKYLARFIENDMKHQAFYNQKGYMNYQVSYGEEQHLPASVRNRIQSAYGEYKITHVANYKLSGRNIWVTNLESLNHIVLVKMEDDEMEEVERNTRSK
jgi:hypothetical protein